MLLTYHICLDNKILDEGACALAESLKRNTTLIQLNLSRMLEIVWFYKYELFNPTDLYVCSGNKIGAKGACALAKSLKYNTTLIRLNLECMLETNIIT